MSEYKDLSKEYNEFFNETRKLFAQVKKYTLLYENLGGGTVGVAPLNDLRGTLDHLYAFMNDFEGENNTRGIAENFIEAKEHLYRAYYDLFTMTSSYLIDEIQAYVVKYGVEVLVKVYPRYFTDVSPELIIIFERIALIRTARETNSKVPDIATITNDQVLTVLLKWHKELLGTTNLFVEAKKLEDAKKEKEAEAEKKGKKKEKKDLILKWVIPISMLILGYFLKKYNG
jgi:hypothetical protein